MHLRAESSESQTFQTFNKCFSQYRETSIFLPFNKLFQYGELLSLSKRFAKRLRKQLKNVQKIVSSTPQHKRFSFV